MSRYHSSDSSSSGGVSVLGVVQIVFIILKLIGTITWPWSVVLIPLWIDLAIVVIALIVALVWCS